jgi:hypothetical protein
VAGGSLKRMRLTLILALHQPWTGTWQKMGLKRLWRPMTEPFHHHELVSFRAERSMENRVAGRVFVVARRRPRL